MYYESETFSNSSCHHIFESENFRFPFLYKEYRNRKENRRELIK